MAILKKLRFEVFKRDGFQCSYCGKQPPEVVLEVDHIEPKSKKGKDNIENLITACFDCNRGKSNILLDKITPQLSENFEVLKQKEEQLKEYRKFVQKIKRRENKDIEFINFIYSDHYEKYEFTELFKNVTLRNFIKKLPLHEVEESLLSAISKFPNDDERVIKYFCGICWNKIKGTKFAE